MGAGFHYGPPPIETVVGSNDAMLSHYVAVLCGLVGVEVSEVMGRARPSRIVTVRHMAQAFARKEREYLLLEVGAFFHRDHASVMNAVSKVEWFLKHPKTASNYFFKVYEAAEAASLTVYKQPFKNLSICQK